MCGPWTAAKLSPSSSTSTPSGFANSADPPRSGRHPSGRPTACATRMATGRKTGSSNRAAARRRPINHRQAPPALTATGSDLPSSSAPTQSGPLRPRGCPLRRGLLCWCPLRRGLLCWCPLRRGLLCWRPLRRGLLCCCPSCDPPGSCTTRVSCLVRPLVERLQHLTHHSALALHDSLGEVEHVVQHSLDVVREWRYHPLCSLVDAVRQIAACFDNLTLRAFYEILDLLPHVLGFGHEPVLPCRWVAELPRDSHGRRFALRWGGLKVPSCAD